jgi:quinolinate synthase
LTPKGTCVRVNLPPISFAMSKPQSTLSAQDRGLVDKIQKLKTVQNAVILAHYYQTADIQDVADHVGDSLELARWAAMADADTIVLCGVRFMAETAKVLNPTKRVLLPDLEAGCSLEQSCPPDDFSAFRRAHPDHVAVTYVNCSAEVKALSDIVCTSSNAEAVIRSIPSETPIIFAPDRNLGRYLINRTGRDMLLWDGACVVHEAFAADKLIRLVSENPDAQIIAHPESQTEVLELASFIGSTAAMLRHVTESAHNTFIVATEAGILHRMQQAVPHKNLIPAPSREDNTCACSECAFMKVNTLQKLHDCLVSNRPEIVLDAELIRQARVPLDRMLALSK